MTLLHGWLNGSLGHDLPGFSFQTDPVPVCNFLMGRVGGMHENFRRGHSVSERFYLPLPGLEESVFAYAGKHIIGILITDRRPLTIIRQRIKPEFIQHAGFKLHFTRRRRKADFFILFVLRRLRIHEVLRLKFLEGHARWFEPIVQHLFEAVPWKMVAKAHAVRQIAPELKCARTVFRRFDRFLRQRQPGTPAPTVRNMVALTEHITRQDVVGQHGGRRHEYLVGNDQILIHKALVDLMLIGVTQQRIIPQRKEGFDRIRIAGNHRPERRARIGHITTHDNVCVAISPDFFRGVSEHVLSTVCIGRMQIRSKLFSALFFAQQFVHAEF